MARITVEDCVKIECKDKATVAALRESAEGVTGLEMLNGIR